MKSLFLFILVSIAFTSCKNNSPSNVFEPKSIPPATSPIIETAIVNDTILYFNDFKSQYVDHRNVEVWLPKGYPAKNIKYQVLYMQDGQNVFNSKTSSTGIAWEIDEKMDSLISINAIKPTIVVTSWNNGKKRFNEYMPQLPSELTESAFAKTELKKNFGYEELYSDDYLKFMTQELRSFVNKNFQTSTKPEHTIIMGSSMGALISLYAMIEYPQIYGKVGCLSTHWSIPYLGQAFIDELPASIPEHTLQKIYFDHGTETQDKDDEPYQLQVNKTFYNLGYSDDDLLYKKFEGHEHSEKYWQRRVAVPLEFLLK